MQKTFWIKRITEQKTKEIQRSKANYKLIYTNVYNNIIA